MLDSIFAADSTLMRILGKLADIVVLNLVFVATSLPLVTLGASLTALASTAMRIVRGQTESVAGDYLRTFRSHLKQGSLVLLVLAGLAVVLGAWYVVVTTLVANVLIQVVLLAVWFVLAVQLVLTGLFAFPYLAQFDDTTRRVLRNARLMSWRHPVASLTALTLTGLPVLITVFYPQVTGYGLLWLAVGFAGIAVVTATLFVRIFDRYVSATASADPAKDGTTHALS